MGLLWNAAKGVGRLGERAIHHALDQRGQENRRRLILGQIAQRGAWSELQRFIQEKQQEAREYYARERVRGNMVPVPLEFQPAWFDGQIAIVRYNLNGQQGRMDIFYGGAGINPLDTPDHDYHGHIVVVNGTVTSWLLPGPRHQRFRLY